MRAQRFLIPAAFGATIVAFAFFLVRDFRPSAAIFRASTEPANLVITTIDLDALVVPVGFEPESRRIAVPDREVGWFTQSSAVDQPGVVFLVGHSDGVFSDLYRVSIGDHLTTSLVSDIIGRVTYQVHSIEILHRDDISMRHVLAAQDHNHELVLMTCYGEFSDAIDTYTHRLIIRAHIIDF
ncbi:class F sortase [Candidatus Saccharibacteria bacterium]|nr:class F sortase [Candidatus Saccharibacteria bacterium]